jgi:hypothetical protein
LHRLDGSEGRKLLEHARGHEIAAVQDQLGPLELPQAGVGKPASPARQMRVRDDGDRGDGGVRLPMMEVYTYITTRRHDRAARRIGG